MYNYIEDLKDDCNVIVEQSEHCPECYQHINELIETGMAIADVASVARSVKCFKD